MKTRIHLNYRKNLWKTLAAMLLVGSGTLSVAAQPNGTTFSAPNGIGWNPGGALLANQLKNSQPQPQLNNNPSPNPTPVNNPAPAPVNPNPSPMPSAVFNNPPTPAPVVFSNPVIPNQGVEKVIACGYDAEGIWRVLPLLVSYNYNGVQYNVTVLNAWDPWTDQWNTGVDQQAYNTDYYLRGVTYNYYAPLSTGTYYFNL